MTVINLTAHDVAALLKDDKIMLIDVREPQEYQEARIEGALLFPLSTFDPHALPQCPEGKRMVFHCKAGGRSAMAAEKCQQQGFPYTEHLAGGIGAWMAAGFPVLSGVS